VSGTSRRARVGVRTLTALVLVLLCCAGSLGGSSTAAVPAATGKNDALQRLGACLAAGGRGQILLSFDTSASLQQSDPDDQRVEAASYLIKQLAKYAGDTGAKLDVAVGGFAHKFDVSTKWTPLTGGSLGAVVADIDKYKDRNKGFETDYWSAVDGARRYLSAKSSGEGSHCQAMVWLSDGMFDLDLRDTQTERKSYGVTKPYGPDVELTSTANVERVEKAGRQDLCRAGGLADQLRVQGVTTLAIGLSGSANPNFTLMKGIATGSACGRDTSVWPGQFLLASEVGDLFFAFDEISDPSHPPITRESKLCQGGAVCREGTQSFVLDATISRVHLLAGADVKGYRLVLEGPKGKQLSIDPGVHFADEAMPGARVSAQWLSDQQLQIDLIRTADPDWVGQWGLAFIDPSKSGGGTARSNVRLFGDVKPTLVDLDKSKLISGKSTQLSFGLVHADNDERVDIANVKSDISVDASLVLPDGSSKTLAKGLDLTSLTRPVRLDLGGVTPGPASVRMTLDLTTAATIDEGKRVSGTRLEPEQVDVPITVLPPPDFPDVQTKVSFGKTEEIGDLPATLAVHGPGCVWLDGSKSLTLPEGVPSLKVTSPASSASTCTKGDLRLNASVDKIGPGLASGTLVVQTRADSGDTTTPVNVAYELEMRRPRDEAVFWEALVGITLAGVLIPVGLLYLVKWRTAKIPGSSITLVSASGRVGPDSSFLDTTSVSEQGARTVVLEGTDRRSVSLNGQSQIQTRAGLWLTESGYCVVTGQPSVSSAPPGTTRNGTSARLPLAVQDRWVALLDPTDPLNGSVEVVFLLSPTSAKLPELHADARSRVPELVDKVRSSLDSSSSGPGTPVAAGRPGTDEWGGSSGSASTGGDDWGGGGSTGTGPGGAGTSGPGGSDDW
jgi:hypothetical protein